MSKKAEIRLGLNSEDVQKDAKKVSKEIKQTLESTLSAGVNLKVSSTEAESAIERVIKAEEARKKKAVENAKAMTVAEEGTSSAAMEIEKRKAKAAEDSARRRLKVEDQVQKKLAGVQNMLKQYDALAKEYPSTYQGTKNTLKDATTAYSSAQGIKDRAGNLPDRELGKLQKQLAELSYKDLGELKSALNQLMHETIRTTKSAKNIETINTSLDRMTVAVDKVSTAMEKAVKKIAPAVVKEEPKTTIDKAEKVALKEEPQVAGAKVEKVATAAAMKAASGVVKDSKGNQYDVTPSNYTNKQLDKINSSFDTFFDSMKITGGKSGAPGGNTLGMTRMQPTINPIAIEQQYMQTLEHFQKMIANTLPKVDTDAGKDKINAIHGLQDRISKSAILTTDMTISQMREVSAQMERMSSTTLREMQRGMSAIERMFKKMADQANAEMKTPILNKERQRQAGEQNLETGVYKPRARSDTSGDVASQMIKLLAAPKQQEMKLLAAPKAALPDNFLRGLVQAQEKAAKTANELAQALENAARSAQAQQATDAANKAGKWEADYTGPTKATTRKDYTPLQLPAGPQENLANMFDKIDFAALDKLASSLSRGEVVDKSNVPGGVASAQAAPAQLRGILDAIPTLTNEMAHNLTAATEGMKFDTLEASITNIEKTFQSISSLLTAGADKFESVMGGEEAASKKNDSPNANVRTPATSLDDLTRKREDLANKLNAVRMSTMGKDQMAAAGGHPDAPENKSLVARQAAAQEQLIATAQKLMAAFDTLTDKVRKDASLTDAQKAQWDTNAKGVRSAMNRVQSSAATAAPEATTKARKMIEASDVTDAVQLRNMLEQVSNTLGKSKRTLLKEMEQNLDSVNKKTTTTKKNLSEIMKRFTQASRASEFLATGSNAADKAAKKLASSYKEVGRVIQGIMISRIFYAGLQQVTAMASAVGQLIVQFEQAQVAMAVMLKDYDKSTRLMNELADFAAKTPFTNQQANQSAQMLMAYGFEAKNLMPIMRDLANATAAVGNPQAFESIARALGQMQTKGKVSAEELRQLTEQGIPAVKILKEQLGLTAKEVQNIGKAGISSDIAIEALLTGIQARYGGAAEALSKTTGGMLSTIGDSVLLMAKSALEPLKNVFDGVLGSMVAKLEELITILRTSGVGGLFEALIPPELQEAARILFANISMLISAFTAFWRATEPVRTVLMQVGIAIANFVLPIVTLFLMVIASLTQILLSNATVVQVLTAALAGLAIGFMVTKIVILFAKALVYTIGVCRGAYAAFMALVKGELALKTMSVVTVNQLSLVVGALLAIIAVIAVLTGKFDGMFSDFSKGIQGMFKVDSSKFFQTTMSDNTASVGEFGEEFAANGDAMDEWGDRMEENANKAKQAVMSFDEVFTLTDPDAGKNDDTTGMGDIEVPDISDGWLPEIPDNSINWDDFFNMGDFEANLDWIIGIFSSLGNILGPIWEGLGILFKQDFWDSLPDGGGALGTILEGCELFFMGISGMFNGFAEFLAGVFMLDLATIGRGWTNFWVGCGDVVEGIILFILGLVETMIEGLDILMSWLFGSFWTDFKKFNADLGEDVAQAWNGMKQVISGFIDFLIGIITLDMELISYGWWQVWDGMGNVLEGIINFILDLCGSLIDWLLGDFLDLLGPLGTILKNMLGSLRDMIGAIIGNIKDIFGGLIDFIVGVFTGDWSRAWEGVCAVFEGIFGGIGNVFIGIMNTVIDAINWAIRQANKLSFDIPEWLGGGTVGISMDEFNRIPYFEKGGLIKKQTLGIMGEGNKHEAVLPLESTSAMSEIARAITDQMQPPPGTPGDVVGGDVNLNVGVLVADDRGIKKLKSMLDEVSKDMKRGRRD